ncbi:MAG: hypothetical protein QM647_05535 [Asticcacaulis sp.]|uniref:hypothetical protein n=1 Tax=Asticcacaulis sp. TaxID=1872648 RepID=UPI0039E53DE9
MTTPIRPSLAQMLNPQGTASAKPATTEQTGGFSNALAAQKAFFQQVTTPKITPATYTAAEVARATATTAPVTSQTAATTTTDVNQPLRRPGSYLNIVV